MANFTQEQLDAICAAYAEGVLTVKYADKEVTYRSLTDMERIINKIKEALGQGGQTVITLATFNKGT